MTTAKIDGAAGCVLALLYMPCLMIGAFLLRGYVLALLWLWLIVPTFHLTPLTAAQAIGLSVIVGYLTFEYPKDSKAKDEDGNDRNVFLVFTKASVVAVIPSLLALLTGYIVSHYI
jgi:hypothetical protein